MVETRRTNHAAGIVMVTGTGGVGKTRLVRRVATDIAVSISGGVRRRSPSGALAACAALVARQR